MELLKQCKKYDYKIYIKYDRFGEPYYSIENYKNSYVKNNLSFRYNFNAIEKEAKKIYYDELKENLSF